MTRTSSMIFLTMALPTLLGLGSANAAEAVKGSAKYEKLEQCVEPTSVMRRNHFEFIKHQRNLTVHEGIRGSKYSLAGCVDCHARKDSSGKFVPVNEEGQFCDECHDYAAVDLKCFECHATVPREK